MQAFTIGLDALTISINPKNPFNQIKDNLTSEKIKKIFLGEYKYWDDVDSSLEHRESMLFSRKFLF